ncbi:cupin domain-containing protein [Aquabacterium sp. J223]|uniref:cupin domain-containing protein n=1 Tax=Aquabacterium sp. J223 TaxID=2898431 RepID=UPI0021AE1951|nr:cupin domain-containing protein [Aquabacterium sp. J223]UUX95284.1 cupin domain-containing protein [Aquabacterium sp. J223]
MTLLTREPAPIDKPMRWGWRELQPLIERAVAEVSMADAERRVILLSHPAFAPDPYTTTNLSAGLQILLPGEHADSHRHTAAALRFVLEGEGAVTKVNGKACRMAEGDLILTPAWCWHEHQNDSDNRLIWFDGLDLPLAAHLRSIFLEFGGRGAVPPQVDDAVARAGTLPTDVDPSYRTISPRYRYAGTDIAAALDALPAQADGSRRLRYVNPVTGGPVMPTLDCYAWRLQQGTATRAYRTTGNAVAVVAKGAGWSRVGDQKIGWQQGDVFTLPHWHWISHCGEAADNQLFLMTDQALLDVMGYLRTEHEA